MDRERIANRAYTVDFGNVLPVTETNPEQIQWQIGGEVLGISVSVGMLPCESGDPPGPDRCAIVHPILDWVDLNVDIQAGKDSLATDGQTNTPIPFSHLGGSSLFNGGPNYREWLRRVDRQTVWNVRVVNRNPSIAADRVVVTFWCREDL